MRIISKRIRELRMSKGWTQAQLAEMLSVSDSTVQKWEVGKNYPPIMEVKRLAEVFCVPTSSLMDDNVVDQVKSKHRTITDIETDFTDRYMDLTPHEIIDINLFNGALLHRFINYAGVAYSAIYVNDFEHFSCEREHEQEMIKYWNDR